VVEQQLPVRDHALHNPDRVDNRDNRDPRYVAFHAGGLVNLDTFNHRRGYRHDALTTWRAALEATTHLPEPTTRIRAAWTRRAVEGRGWRYEVWTGAERAEVDNVRLLAATAGNGCSIPNCSTSCAPLTCVV
jgi:hypothetical protein